MTDAMYTSQRESDSTYDNVGYEKNLSEDNQETGQSSNKKDDGGHQLRDLKSKLRGGECSNNNGTTVVAIDSGTCEQNGVINPLAIVTLEDEGETDHSSITCSDAVYRNKVVDTLWLSWNMTIVGWTYGQMGPSLPDLQLISGAPLQKASWLFTGFAIGYLVGCLISGFVLHKFNQSLVLFLSTMCNAVMTVVLPWIPDFYVMVVVRVISGIAFGGQDTVIHSMLFALWTNQSGQFIQMTYCLFAIGGIISPLVTQQFSLEYSDSQEEILQGSGNASSESSTNFIVPLANTSSTTSTVSSSNIQWAFLITGVLLVSSAIPFLVAFLRGQRTADTVEHNSNDSRDRYKIPKNVKRLIIALLLINALIANSYIDMFPGFLTTFILQVKDLELDLDAASTLTSIYFGTYSAGNFLGIFILKYVTSTQLIAFSYISSGITLIGLLLSVIYTHVTLFYITVALSGITMSAILSMLFTWTQENVMPITSRMASALLLSGSAGFILNPLLIGYLMEDVSPMWFIYLTLVDTVVCAILFSVSLVLTKSFTASLGFDAPNMSCTEDTLPKSPDVNSI